MSLCQQPALVPVFHLTDRKKGGSQRSSSPKTLKMSMAELAPAASHRELLMQNVALLFLNMYN